MRPRGSVDGNTTQAFANDHAYLDRILVEAGAGIEPYRIMYSRGLATTTKVPRESLTDKKVLVEPSGIEPLTSCMPCRRSPS